MFSQSKQPLILNFSAIGEIQDPQTRKKAEDHFNIYSRSVTYPYLSSLPVEGRAMLTSLMRDYVEGHKSNYAKNLVFDPTALNLSNFFYARY